MELVWMIFPNRASGLVWVTTQEGRLETKQERLRFVTTKGGKGERSAQMIDRQSFDMTDENGTVRWSHHVPRSPHVIPAGYGDPRKGCKNPFCK